MPSPRACWIATAAFVFVAACTGEDDRGPPAAIDPGLAERLAAAPADAIVEIDVQLDVPRFRPPPMPPMVATIESGGPADPLRFTLDGAPISATDFARRTDADRERLDANLRAQLAARRAAVDAAIADAGIADAVLERGHSGFRVALTPDRARAALDHLGDRIRAARLAERPIASVTTVFDQQGGDLDRIGVLDFAQAPAYGLTGAGIGIWHAENFSPYLFRDEFDDADVRLLTPSSHWEPTANGSLCRYNDECCSGSCAGSFIKVCQNNGTCPNCGGATCNPGIRTLEHATMCAMVAHETAPEATVYHSTPVWADCLIDYDTDTIASPPIYVGTQSWSVEGTTVGNVVTNAATNNSYNVFGTCNRDWDDFVVSSRIAHFHAAGNVDANFVGDPARAYNVTAVGRYDAATGTMSEPSGWKNPSTQVEKPEIVAPGTNVELATGWTRSGSSISTPIAAGFAADMMTVAPFFRNAPQAIRAYLIAGAHNVDDAAGFSATASAKDGAGRIDFLDTYYYRSGKIWSGGNDAYFVDNKIVETAPLTAGQRYTVAIAWLADGQYAFDQTNGNSAAYALDMRMKLTVSNGAYSYVGYQSKNNFQLVDFTAPVGGTWTITIERIFDANVGPLNLALTVGRHS